MKGKNPLGRVSLGQLQRDVLSREPSSWFCFHSLVLNKQSSGRWFGSLTGALGFFPSSSESSSSIDTFIGVFSFVTEMEDRCHVFQENSNIYNATLGLVDIVRGTNSYYKLQLLKDDKKNS